MGPLKAIGGAGQRARIRSLIQNNKISTIATMVTLLVLLTFGVLFAIHSESTSETEVPVQPESEEMAIKKKVRIAMLPTNDVFNPEAPTLSYERAKENMDKLAAGDKGVAESRYFALNMFELCMGLEDRQCMDKQARKVKSLSSVKDPYAADTTKQIADKIAQYGN